MSKNKVVLFVFLALFFISPVISQSNQSNVTSQTVGSGSFVDQAYSCLQTEINGKTESELSFQEAVFGVLAIGANSKLVSVIDDKEVSNHWDESGNALKDTSQALLAYNRINRNTDDVESWILDNEITASELTWFLQIDIENRESSSCSVSYGGNSRTVTVNDDQTLSGSGGSCLSISGSGYWLQVNNNCIDEEFSVSCDQDFVTNTLYRRSGSATLFVSQSTHSAPALGTTTETINSKCFSESNSCDYEGTLWAAWALDSTGRDVSTYLPYLLALSEANQKFLPSAFLHGLTSGADQYSDLVQLQQQNQYWQAPNTPYNRYYDSALAMASLQGTGANELSNSQSYFGDITTPQGCWNNNNIRDTAFLLYAGWPRAVSGIGGSGGGSDNCETNGYYCTSVFSCSNIGGEILDFDCSTGEACCSQTPALQSCSAQSGVVCSSDRTCSGTSVPSLDGSCCLGTCQALPTANECELQGGNCYSSCNENEAQQSYSCGDSGGVCCFTQTSNNSGSSFGVWITVLIVLVVIVVLSIVFRNRLKIILFKFKNRKSKGPRVTRGPPPGGRPPFPPGKPLLQRGQPRPIPRNTPVRGTSQKDKEMEETMKKLREMSK